MQKRRRMGVITILVLALGIGFLLKNVKVGLIIGLVLGLLAGSLTTRK
jgi:hypothetical protein